jgi:hypothetical protein
MKGGKIIINHNSKTVTIKNKYSLKMRKVLSGARHIYFAGNLKSCIFAKGKSYTTSSC